MPGHSPLEDEIPWVTFRAIDWLESFLQPTMDVFEYGAGGSTLYLTKRVHRVISVEHDEGFSSLVQGILSQRNIGNCQLVLHKSEPCEDGTIAFASHQIKYRGLCFEAYVKAIDIYPDRSFDLVMVDGRARTACMQQALAKVKPGGALLLDNSDRPAYAETKRMLADFPRSDFFGITPWNMDVSQTSVWRIPD